MTKCRHYYFKIILFIVLLLSVCFHFSVYAGSDIKIRDFANIFYIPAVAVPVGSSANQLARELSPATVNAYTDTGETVTLPVEWDYSTVNFSLCGAYEITGQPSLSEGYSLTGDCSLPRYRTTVSVQTPGYPDINVYSHMISAGLFVFPWLPVSDDAGIEIYIKKENSSWTSVLESGFGLCLEDCFYLSGNALSTGNRYSLGLRYRGRTMILRFYYSPEGELDIMSYNPGTIESGTDEDDRSDSHVIRSLEPTDSRMLKRLSAYAVPVNGSLAEKATDLESAVRILGSTSEQYENTISDPAIELTVSWDLSEVNTAVPGVYKVSGTLTPPENYVLADNMDIPEIYAYISIQNPSAPQINTYYMPSREIFFFPSCLNDAIAENARIYCSVDKGAFHELDEEQGWIASDGMYLLRNWLVNNSYYQFYITWKNKSTGIYSFHYTDDFITNDQWLERNYADRSDKNFPDFSQDEEITHEPISSVKNESAAPEEGESARKTATTSTVTETVTDKWTVISGQKLKALLGISNGNISFEKKGISVLIPDSTVTNWNVDSDETLQVMIQSEEDSFSVHIYHGDKEISEIPGASIQLPLSADEDTLTVEDSSGNVLETDTDEKQNIVTVKTDQTGDFYLKGKKSGQKLKSLQIFLILFILASGAVYRTVLRKRGE